MRAEAGVFASLDDAASAQERLQQEIPAENVKLLTPETPEQEVERTVPTTEAMPPVGGRMGMVLGGSLGLLGGLVLPDMGAVTITAVLLGLAGAVLGALVGRRVGGALDRHAEPGVPVDELFVYEDALRQGRCVVVAFVEGRRRERVVRRLLREAGAESLDAARSLWWKSIRDGEEAVYHGDGGDFHADEAVYRRGFEAAMERRAREAGFEQRVPELQRRFSGLVDEPAFRRGYERGLQHREQIQKLRSS